MSREVAPGGLGVEPGSAVEAFALQEAVRYRSALLSIMEELRDPASAPGGKCLVILMHAERALIDGDEAAG